MIDLADSLVAPVADEEVPGSVHRDTSAVQFGGGGRAVVPAVSPSPVAGHSGDHAGGVVHLADAVEVGNKDITGGVHCDVRGEVEFGGGGRAVIAAVATRMAGDRGDHSGGVIHFTDHAVIEVSDKEVPGSVGRNT